MRQRRQAPSKGRKEKASKMKLTKSMQLSRNKMRRSPLFSMKKINAEKTTSNNFFSLRSN
jgi:hypothetical protein